MVLVGIVVAGALIGAIAFLLMPTPPTPPGPEPATLSEFKFPQHEEAKTQGVVFGDVWVPDWEVLNYGQFSTKSVRKCS